MKITNCLMNHLENPLGFAMDAPVFSYQVEDAAGKRRRRKGNRCWRILALHR